MEDVHTIESPSPQRPLEPNQEQLASPLSSLLYSYLDKLVLKADHVAHLSLDMLPELANNDHTEYLTKKGFPVRGVLDFIL